MFRPGDASWRFIRKASVKALGLFSTSRNLALDDVTLKSVGQVLFHSADPCLWLTENIYFSNRAHPNEVTLLSVNVVCTVLWSAAETQLIRDGAFASDWLRHATVLRSFRTFDQEFVRVRRQAYHLQAETRQNNSNSHQLPIIRPWTRPGRSFNETPVCLCQHFYGVRYKNGALGVFPLAQSLLSKGDSTYDWCHGWLCQLCCRKD